MKKALIVGIDHYSHMRCLSGCVNDALALYPLLRDNENSTSNFKAPYLLTSSGPSSPVTRAELKSQVRDLFAGSTTEVALLYFAGHGHIEETGGYVCATDSRYGDDGLPFADIMALARRSQARSKIIILDCCHGGAVGESPGRRGATEIDDGMTILTASTADQYALETPGGGSGVFTKLLVDALQGAAANLLGDVTPGSVYAHIDQSLGPWCGQRPVFKTNVAEFVSLRRVAPPIPREDLLALPRHFPMPDFEFSLDPAYEPERSADQLANPLIPPPDPAKTIVFEVLQRYTKVNLVRPIGARHMWHAAMQSKSCGLTILGKHYQRLAVQQLL